MQKEILEDALFYLIKMGWSVIPLNKDKKPMIQWERYQYEKATKDDVTRWFTKYPDSMIGIVTGGISNLCVIDYDTKEGGVPSDVKTLVAETPRGYHAYYHFEEGITNRAGVKPHVDVRGEGGYVVAPPSVNEDGIAYKWLGKPTDIVDLPPGWADHLREQPKEHKLIETDGIEAFVEGRRDEDLFNLAYTLFKAGKTTKEVVPVVLAMAEKCAPPFPRGEALTKIKSAEARARRKDILPAGDCVKEFVDMAMGWFKIDEVYRFSEARDRIDKKNISQALARLIDQGVLTRHPRANGLYRKLDKERDVMHWRGANIQPVSVELPLGISEFFAVYPKNTLVFAGTPDAGKTALFLDFIKRYKGTMKVTYFNSEMAEEELKLRIMAHEDAEPDDWNFEAVSRVAQFADVIDPDGINIIDYMELGDEIYKVGLFMRELHDKLDSGIALVGIQKPFGRDFGYGKELAMQIPRLYVSLEYHKKHKISSARILKCKNRLTPYSMIGKLLYYKIFDGWKFQEQGTWHYEGDDPQDDIVFEKKKKGKLF